MPEQALAFEAARDNRRALAALLDLRDPADELGRRHRQDPLRPLRTTI
jgi:hypothetical protein